MKQKKRVWMSFNLWEANVFEQYLEEMAAQGWFLESVGGSVMKFHRAEPAKRRYAALLVPGSSSLTGADSWKAEQFRKQCQEAGWNFECSGTFWQIFYTTDDAVERTGDMTEEKAVPDPEIAFLDLVCEALLPCSDRIRGMGGIPILAKSRETVFRFHAASS